MKQYSLRQARKIDQRIAAMIAEMKSAYTGSVGVSMYEQQPLQAYSKESHKQRIVGDSIAKLIGIRKRIRDEIAVANYTNGIARKISRRKELIDLKDLYTTISAATSEVVPQSVVEYFESKSAQMKAHPVTDPFSYRLDRVKKNKDMIEIPVLSEEMLENTKKKVRMYSSELEQVEEELLSMNAVIMIDAMNDDEYEFLKELGVV